VTKTRGYALVKCPSTTVTSYLLVSVIVQDMDNWCKRRNTFFPDLCSYRTNMWSHKYLHTHTHADIRRQT